MLVNPQIISRSEEVKECEEGCLSLPGIYEKVKRPSLVTVRAQDLEGREFTLECDELLSVCGQHEVDHLDGKVFIDHLRARKKARSAAKLAKKRKEEARARKNKEA